MLSNSSLAEIVRRLQSTEFRDLSGARVSATIPVSERLVNEIVTASLPRNVPVKEVRVQPLAGDAFAVRLAPKAALLPALSLRLEIIQQPDLPSTPVLVLRMATMGALFGLASAAFPIAGLLPPGVRLDGDRILLDLAALAARAGAADLLPHLSSLRVNTEDGRVDHEAELGVVIKKRAFRVRMQQASEYILGLTSVNDVTARELQSKDGQYTRGKGFDTFAPIGPCVAVGLEGRDLQVRGYVNGNLRQDSRTRELIFTIPELVEFISSVMTLLPGDIISTGTPSGIGPIKPGDQVTIHVEGVGALTNPVVARDN